MSTRGAKLRRSLTEISRWAGDRELRRQVIYNRTRAAAMRSASQMPAQLAEYLRLLTTSIAGFWMLTVLLDAVSAAGASYTLPVLGLLFSAQATLYKFKLASDPGFEISGCGCGGGRADDTAEVLRSNESSVFGVPNSVLAILFYAALLGALVTDRSGAAIALAVAASVASAYLGYVMVFRLERLCHLCVNVTAINLLILAHLVL